LMHGAVELHVGPEDDSYRLRSNFNYSRFFFGKVLEQNPLAGKCRPKYPHSPVTEEPTAKTHCLGARIRSLVPDEYFTLDAGIERMSG